MSRHTIALNDALREKLISFLLVDAINDDTRFLSELRFDLSLPYEGIEANITLIDVRKGLAVLFAEDYVYMELVTDPEMLVLRELDIPSAVENLTNEDNWSSLENGRAYAISTKDGKRSIQLENALYNELRSRGVTLAIKSYKGQ
ncbi:MAG: hypothetical protein JNM62_14645 [Flavobacteriales bacterium]|nr:hypothetical protein [Flavobacteriales bacterium]